MQVFNFNKNLKKMDSLEKNFSTDNENSQIDESAKTKGKRLRIKDTRKVDYNSTASSSRPYQPLFGQTKQTPSYQPQSAPSHTEGNMDTHHQHTSERQQEDKKYHSEDGGNYVRRNFNPHEQSGFQQRSYGNQGGHQQRRSFDNNQGGYQQRRSYDSNQETNYQPRRSYDNNQETGYQQKRSYDNNQNTGYQQRRSYPNQDDNKSGGYQQRNYSQGGGYNQNRGYNQGGGYNKTAGFNQGNDSQGGSYNQNTVHGQGGGYQQRGGGYNQSGSYQQRGGGYSQGGGYQQRGGYNQGGGYQQRSGYNQGGGYHQQRPGGGRPNMRRPMQGERNQPFRPYFPNPIKYQEVVTDVSAPIRLNKYLANAGVCSRREADEFIQAGVIRVNGEVITELGTKITRLDKVTFNEEPVQIESKIYILLNKPKNCVTTSDDPQNRQTVMDLVKNACQERIYPVGRLDRNTTGVLLLTNDGEMAAKLTHPSFKKKKIYHVWLDREVTVEDMEKLANGIELEDGEIHADAISYANDEDKSQVGIEIHSGKNRIVRRMFEVLEYHVLKLDRVYFAGLTKRNLGRGKWRYLSENEVNSLRMGAYE